MLFNNLKGRIMVFIRIYGIWADTVREKKIISMFNEEISKIMPEFIDSTGFRIFFPKNIKDKERSTPGGDEFFARYKFLIIVDGFSAGSNET